MKKMIRFSIFSAALFLFLSHNAFPQISVGLRGGVNISSFKAPRPVKFNSKAGLNAALLINIPFSPKFSLQIEPGFSQRGSNFDMDGQWNLDSARQRTHIFGKILLGYVEVPLVFQYKPRFGKFEGIVSLGPELRFSLGPQEIKSTSRTYKDGVLVEDTYTEYDMRQPNGYRTFDFGLVGGVGVSYPLQFGRIFTEARYHYGLRRMTSNSELYNKGVSIHMGILIPIKK